jgi:hypothetical protein
MSSVSYNPHRFPEHISGELLDAMTRAENRLDYIDAAYLNGGGPLSRTKYAEIRESIDTDMKTECLTLDGRMGAACLSRQCATRIDVPLSD